jgi:hypothetical protein
MVFENAPPSGLKSVVFQRQSDDSSQWKPPGTDNVLKDLTAFSTCVALMFQTASVPVLDSLLYTSDEDKRQ